MFKNNQKTNTPKIIIWGLFDDGEHCYTKTIAKYWLFENIEIHSIGIQNKNFPKNKQFFYHQINLSLANAELINQLNQLPKPNIILASPPCESWSSADCAGQMIQKINEDSWLINNKNYYDEYNKNCHKNKRRNFLQKERSRILGEAPIFIKSWACVEDDAQIIFKLDPKYTKPEVIENTKNCDYIDNLHAVLEECKLEKSWIEIRKN